MIKIDREKPVTATENRVKGSRLFSVLKSCSIILMDRTLQNVSGACQGKSHTIYNALITEGGGRKGSVLAENPGRRLLGGLFPVALTGQRAATRAALQHPLCPATRCGTGSASPMGQGNKSLQLDSLAPTRGEGRGPVKVR